MRKTIYSCDTCGRVLSDGDKISRPHISVIFGKPSGWVSNHLNYVQHWQHDSFTAGVYQFCNGRCLARHFSHLAKEKSVRYHYTPDGDLLQAGTNVKYDNKRRPKYD